MSINLSTIGGKKVAGIIIGIICITAALIVKGNQKVYPQQYLMYLLLCIGVVLILFSVVLGKIDKKEPNRVWKTLEDKKILKINNLLICIMLFLIAGTISTIRYYQTGQVKISWFEIGILCVLVGIQYSKGIHCLLRNR